MAHPKRKVSKTRRDKRRTHYKAVAPALSVCSSCGATIKSHRICGECGSYRGQVVVETQAAE